MLVNKVETLRWIVFLITKFSFTNKETPHRSVSTAGGKMKTSILILILSAASISFSQTIYEVTPGTKVNQIIISLSNISDIENAENVQVKIKKYYQNLCFNKEEQ